LSHHPLLAMLAEAPCILHAWLRCGNTIASRGIVEFPREVLVLILDSAVEVEVKRY
jgi:hypothetical protein